MVNYSEQYNCEQSCGWHISFDINADMIYRDSYQGVLDKSIMSLMSVLACVFSCDNYTQYMNGFAAEIWSSRLREIVLKGW
jgi:hypothetical protein